MKDYGTPLLAAGAANAFSRGLIFTGKHYRILFWPWNVLQGHRGWRHWTKHILLATMSSIVTLAVSLSVSALQSILCWNGIAGRRRLL